MPRLLTSSLPTVNVPTISRLPLHIAIVATSLLPACTPTTPPPRPPPPSVKAQDKPGVLLRLGDDVRRTGDAPDALSLYRSAANAAPHDPAPLTRMGEGLNDTDDPQRAEQAFRGALALNPDDAPARHGLAIALLAERRPAEAYAELERLDAAHDARIERAIGTALDMLGRGPEAQAAYRRGLALAPTDSVLHGNLALSLALANDDAGALSEMRSAIASPQPDPRQEANAVMVLGLLGRTDEATARGNQTIGADATRTLLARVARARAATDPAARAAALGVITSNTPSAPPAPHTSLPPPDTSARPPELAPAPVSTGSTPTASAPTISASPGQAADSAPAHNPSPSSAPTRPADQTGP